MYNVDMLGYKVGDEPSDTLQHALTLDMLGCSRSQCRSDAPITQHTLTRGHTSGTNPTRPSLTPLPLFQRPDAPITLAIMSRYADPDLR
jgi:hypothetical protein